MINLKPNVLQALEGNAALVTLLGGSRIYSQVAPVETSWQSWVTFFETDNFDSDFANDTAYGSEIHIQTDIWSRSGTSAVAAEVNKTMEGLGFTRYSSVDLYETDTKIYHKPMRYVIKKEI